MYRTNGLWYARVGTDQALIDTAESPSIGAAEYKDGSTLTPSLIYDTPDSNDNDDINMIIQDNAPTPMSYQCDLFHHTTP